MNSEGRGNLEGTRICGMRGGDAQAAALSQLLFFERGKLESDHRGWDAKQPVQAAGMEGRFSRKKRALPLPSEHGGRQKRRVLAWWGLGLRAERGPPAGGATARGSGDQRRPACLGGRARPLSWSWGWGRSPPAGRAAACQGPGQTALPRTGPPAAAMIRRGQGLLRSIGQPQLGAVQVQALQGQPLDAAAHRQPGRGMEQCRRGASRQQAAVAGKPQPQPAFCTGAGGGQRRGVGGRLPGRHRGRRAAWAAWRH